MPCCGMPHAAQRAQAAEATHAGAAHRQLGLPAAKWGQYGAYAMKGLTGLQLPEKPAVQASGGRSAEEEDDCLRHTGCVSSKAAVNNFNTRPPVY